MGIALRLTKHSRVQERGGVRMHSETGRDVSKEDAQRDRKGCVKVCPPQTTLQNKAL